MREAGYGPDARLAVDDDYLALAQHIRRMLAATKMVDAPERKRNEKLKVPAPLYTQDEIWAELDLVPGESPSKVVAGILADRELDISDWDAIEASDKG